MPGPPHLDRITWMVAPGPQPPEPWLLRLLTESRSPAALRLRGAYGACTREAPRFRPQGWARRAWVAKPAPLGSLCL